LNDESLFGSLKTDQNLIEEGNMVLGSDLNNSANNDEDEIVFQEPTPVTNGTDDELSSVIGHGIVGKDIPIMARLAKARRWSKQ
jgi:hypothetical protein